MERSGFAERDPGAVRNWREACERFVRVGLGALFLWAGISKAMDPLAFADGVAAYRLLPGVLINSVALGLPVFEIVLGLGLISGWRQRLLALIASLLLLVFVAALLQANGRSLKIDCACFGEAVALEKLVPPLPRDVVLLAAAVALYARGRSREAAQKLADRSAR